jgi:tetratricopeptide (TPR) repeat protein
MNVWIAVLVFYFYCAGLWAFARSDNPFKGMWSVNAALVAGFWLLAGWIALATRAKTGIVTEGNVVAAVGLGGVLLLIAIGILVAVPYWWHLLSLMAEGGIKNVLVNAENMVVSKTFDVADKAEKERRYDDAIALYLAAAKEAPRDPEPLRRAGEAMIRKGDVEAGLARLREALALTTAPEDVASASFRIAELLDRTLARRSEARAVLEAAAKRLDGSRFAEYAIERLKALA